MKFEVKKEIDPAAFVPVALTLTFETKMELDAFATFFNAAPIAEPYCGMSGVRIEKIIEMTNRLAALGAEHHNKVDLVCDSIASHSCIKSRLKK